MQSNSFGMPLAGRWKRAPTRFASAKVPSSLQRATPTVTEPRAAALEPYSTRHLDTGDGHQIFLEESGNPAGIPAVFLHGGPGSGAQPLHRRLFDSARHRAILLDQRGAGRSRPWLSLDNNTTAHLVADLELIRETLGIARWLVVGGSWGSTLALAYAERHPERVLGVAMRAVFLSTPEEAHWAFVEGPRRFHPEIFERFLGFLPEAERGAPLQAYYSRLLSPDPAVQVPTAWMWHHYERLLSEIRPTGGIPAELRTTGKPPPTAVMEAHYLSNNCFLGPDELVANAARLTGIPGVIVQSRYDLLCPPVSAHRIHRAWPGSELRMVEAAGHSAGDPGVMDALRQAIADLTSRLAPAA